MSVLILGAEDGPLRLEDAKDREAIVLHHYRHILSPEDLMRAPLIINLHASYLPWNRGAHPNLWSILEDTPKGVTIHRVDAGLDTGPIYAQERVEPQLGDTFRSSYDRLETEISALLKNVLPGILSGDAKPLPQRGLGSIHRSSDLAKVWGMLPFGWDTPIAWDSVQDYIACVQLSRESREHELKEIGA